MKSLDAWSYDALELQALLLQQDIRDLQTQLNKKEQALIDTKVTMKSIERKLRGEHG